MNAAAVMYVLDRFANILIVRKHSGLIKVYNFARQSYSRERKKKVDYKWPSMRCIRNSLEIRIWELKLLVPNSGAMCLLLH